MSYVTPDLEYLVPHSTASDVAPRLCLEHGEESQSHFQSQGHCGEEKTHGRHRGGKRVGGEMAGVRSGGNVSDIQGQELEIQISVAGIVSPQGKASRVGGSRAEWGQEDAHSWGLQTPWAPAKEMEEGQLAPQEKLGSRGQRYSIWRPRTEGSETKHLPASELPGYFGSCQIYLFH